MRHLLLAIICMPVVACADATPPTCLEIVLTGTQGGPPAVNGLAGAGTLVRYGTVENQCNDIKLQFDAGRGTTMRLSQMGLSPNDIDAVFLTHMHSDHTEGLLGLMQLRWHYTGGPVDLICGAQTAVGDRAISCRAFSEHIGDAFIAAGEIAQRRAENNKRHAEGPAGLINLIEVTAGNTASQVWTSGDVTVSAVSVNHISGSLAFRVDTPAGSVVIGGDAGNSVAEPPRETSTSQAVERLAEDADILVHSAIHFAFAPGSGSNFPALAYYRQSSADDLGALAKRAGVQHLVLTHLIPALGVAAHGPFVVAGGPLSDADYVSQAKKAGFEGQVHVGSDLLTVRLTD